MVKNGSKMHNFESIFQLFFPGACPPNLHSMTRGCARLHHPPPFTKIPGYSPGTFHHLTYIWTHFFTISRPPLALRHCLLLILLLKFMFNNNYLCHTWNHDIILDLKNTQEKTTNNDSVSQISAGELELIDVTAALWSHRKTFFRKVRHSFLVT